MIKQIKKVGNGHALFLDKALLEVLGLEAGSDVLVTVHEGALIITPANPRPVDKARFEATLERVTTTRRDVLRRLAQ